MKKPITKLLSILFALFLPAGAAVSASMPAHATIKVKGLACPFCVQGLEKHLKKLDAVAAVQTSLKKGEAVVDFKSDRSASKEELRAAVKKAGFTAGRILIQTKSEDAPTSGETDQPDGNPEAET